LIAFFGQTWGVSNLEVDPVETSCGGDAAGGARLDWLDGREVALGRYTVVRRLLPHTNRRMVGAWCFFDHFGPDAVFNTPGMLVPTASALWPADRHMAVCGHRPAL